MAKSIKNAAELFAEENNEISIESFEAPIDMGESEDMIVETIEEVSEEVVQAVAEAIVEQSIEDDKSVEEIVEEIIDESEGQYIPMEDDKGEIKDIFPTRGFKSLEDAKDWTKSSDFTNLGKADQEEFLTWLKNI